MDVGFSGIIYVLRYGYTWRCDDSLLSRILFLSLDIYYILINYRI